MKDAMWGANLVGISHCIIRGLISLPLSKKVYDDDIRLRSFPWLKMVLINHLCKDFKYMSISQSISFEHIIILAVSLLLDFI